MPKIDSDDLMLFGSLALTALGAAVVTGEATGSPLMALGALLIVFGLPATLITFMAAAEESK